MLRQKPNGPITLFNCAQCGVDMKQLQHSLQDAYSEYEWDLYLLQQNKIAIIKERASKKEIESTKNSVWLDLYLGKTKDSEIPKIFKTLPMEAFKKLSSLKPTRKRCVSEYEIYWNDRWTIERVPSKPFAQANALISNIDEIDYRTSERKFKELPNELFNENLRSLLISVSQKIRDIQQENLKLKKINAVVHHTAVYCYPDQVSTNSPEGIHQDGMDYIVSALVIERKNISGGKSIIYGSDKKTKILQYELQEGQGLFQPDAGTDLWHEVTPIAARDGAPTAFRSIIGFDFLVENDG